ncbi:ubiquitin carboxyl-terminal hydrolase 40 isoform X6 [Ochotona princeps]|nr:ubiquitin carboxyl-terminal hydrolase 40 isoform X6 [Ochotona princeps]
MEIVVEETVSVSDCLKLMLDKAGLSGETWHLRRMDWCYEAGEPLCEEGATLKELMVSSGDTLLVMEGKLPPLGFLKVPVWWYQAQEPSRHWKSHQDPTSCALSPAGDWGAACMQGAPGDLPAEASLLYLGDIEISEDATLADLKCQAMTLPPLSERAVPSPAFLRAWTVEGRRPGRLLRSNRQQLRDCKLGRRAGVCLEPLPAEEHLGPQDVLLRTRLRIPGVRAYAPAEDLVWDAARGWTASSLRQKVASFYSLPVEKIEIAKYFPEKFEWLPISSWNQQVTKRKKKKKQDSLQGAPYYLKDGDIVGVKNLLADADADFSTAMDDIGKENQKQLALGKKKSREALRVQSSEASSAPMPSPPRGPEAGLSIHVRSFR